MQNENLNTENKKMHQTKRENSATWNLRVQCRLIGPKICLGSPNRAAVHTLRTFYAKFVVVHVYPNFTERFRLLIVIEAQFEVIKRKYSEQFQFCLIRSNRQFYEAYLGYFWNALNTLQGNLYKTKAM